MFRHSYFGDWCDYALAIKLQHLKFNFKENCEFLQERVGREICAPIKGYFERLSG